MSAVFVLERFLNMMVTKHGIDFNNIDSLENCIKKYEPDFLVNTSRVYSGLKYGSLSWNNIRAYGIWSPLAIKFIRNIMLACDKADMKGVVINTSYSDAVIPWLKTAGIPYPDLGSGNINHLIPRIKYAVADIINVSDFWNIDIMYATSHFHDVVISKEGHSENVVQLLKVFYQGKELDVDQNEILKRCKIPMPTDAKRNMMNASSNYDIIATIIDAVRLRKTGKVFSPGAFGEIGGYPITIQSSFDKLEAHIDESIFSIGDMRNANRQSIALDGIEDVRDGYLIYTDLLLEKVKNVWGVNLPKKVHFTEIDKVAKCIIEDIILPQTNKK